MLRHLSPTFAICVFLAAAIVILHEPQPSAHPPDGYSAFPGVIMSGDPVLVQHYLKMGASPTRKASRNFHPIDIAVGALENVPRRQIRRLDGKSGPPPEDTRVLELLLAVGADPNGDNSVLGRPLDIATYQGLTQSVRILLESGARLRLSNAPWIAAYHCYPDIAELFLRDSSLTEGGKRSMRHTAKEEGCDVIVKLIDGASPKQKMGQAADL